MEYHEKNYHSKFELNKKVLQFSSEELEVGDTFVLAGITGMSNGLDIGFDVYIKISEDLAYELSDGRRRNMKPGDRIIRARYSSPKEYKED